MTTIEDLYRVRRRELAERDERHEQRVNKIADIVAMIFTLGLWVGFVILWCTRIK